MRGHESSNGSQAWHQLLAAVGAAATAGLAGYATLAAPDDDFDIGVTAVAFDPSTVTVEAGNEVVRCNTSSRGHTVTAYEGALPEGAAFSTSGGCETEQAAYDVYSNPLGGLIGSGETYAYSFDVPGEYEYLCIPHEQIGMVGTIIVEE